MMARYVEENKLSGIPAVVGLPAETVFLSLLTPPPGPRRARDSAVRAHLEGLHSLSGSDTVSDVFPLSSRGGQRPMLVGVARRDAVSALIDPLQAAGVRVVAAVPVSLAFFNLAMEHLSTRNLPLVLLCPVSDSGMEVLVGVGRHLRGVWRLPLHLSNDPGSEASLQALGAELKSIRRDHPVRRAEEPLVVWCGETPLPDAVGEHLARELGIRPVGFEEWFQEKIRPAAGALLVGALAQVAMRPVRIPLNLLPFPLRENAARRALLPYRAAAAALFAVFAITQSLQGFRRLGDVRRRLERAEAQWEELQTLLGVEEELQKRNASLSRQVAALRYSANSPLLARDLLIGIARAKHPDDWIVRIADAQSYFSAPSSPVATDSNGGLPVRFAFDPHLVIVEGYTLGADLSSVLSFIEALRVHPQVVAVDLLGDDRVAPNRAHELLRSISRIRRFVMEVRIREP